MQVSFVISRTFSCETPFMFSYSDAAICRLVGVPCLIGAKDATFMFKTGDNLVLNGTKGVVSKLIEE